MSTPQPDRTGGEALGGFEYAFVVSGLLAFGSLRLVAAQTDGTGPPQVPTWANVVLLAYAASAGVLMWRRSRRSSAFLYVLALCVAYCVLSSLWSISPDQTLKRSLGLAMTTVFACYLGVRFSTAEWAKALLLTTTALIGFEVLFIYAAPSLGRHPAFDEWPGAWRGLQGHKNALGRMAVLYILILLLAMPGRHVASAVAKGALLAGSGLLLFGAQSTTAAACLAAALVALTLLNLWWISPLLAAALAGGAALVTATFAVMASDLLARALDVAGKGDISGRLPLWSLVADIARQRLWFGFGYEGFWSADNPEVARIQQLLSWHMAYSHNGLLETLLNGGVALAAPIAAVLAVAWIKALRLALASADHPPAALPFLLLTAILLSNATESVIFARADFTWILLVSAIVQTSASAAAISAGDA